MRCLPEPEYQVKVMAKAKGTTMEVPHTFAHPLSTPSLALSHTLGHGQGEGHQYGGPPRFLASLLDQMSPSIHHKTARLFTIRQSKSPSVHHEADMSPSIHHEAITRVFLFTIRPSQGCICCLSTPLILLYFSRYRSWEAPRTCIKSITHLQAPGVE
jgi:hypothetical protein